MSETHDRQALIDIVLDHGTDCEHGLWYSQGPELVDRVLRALSEQMSGPEGGAVTGVPS